MREAEVRERAFAMPLTNPAYPPGPYRFIDREYLIITYRTDPGEAAGPIPRARSRRRSAPRPTLHTEIDTLVGTLDSARSDGSAPPSGQARPLARRAIRAPSCGRADRREGAARKTEIGLPRSVGSGSMIAGIRLFGEIRRKLGLNRSPALMSTG